MPEPIVDEVFGVFLVFARVGGALMLLPGFGEPYILTRHRLLLALFVSLAMAGALGPSLPPVPAETLTLARLVAGEAVLGLFIGAAARALFSALHIAGTAIAFQSGLAAAAFFDPNEGTQGTLPGTFLTTTALVLLFLTDGHHLLLKALAASYGGVPPGGTPPFGDMADLLARLVNEAFTVGVQIAAPLLVVSLLMYLLMGILNRLMPTFQVFFIALPLQILIAFATVMLSLSGAMLVFFAYFEDGVAGLTLGG